MRIHEHTFDSQDVVLDFHEFDHCSFTRCRFLIHGHGAFRLVGNHITDSSFALAGPAAITVQTLQHLYHGGAREWVEQVIAEIRRPPGSPPPPVTQ